MKIERSSYIIAGMSGEAYVFVKKFYVEYDNVPNNYDGGKFLTFERNFFINNYQRFAEILHDAIPAIKLNDIRIDHSPNPNRNWLNKYPYSYDIGFDCDASEIVFFKKQLTERGIVL